MHYALSDWVTVVQPLEGEVYVRRWDGTSWTPDSASLSGSTFKAIKPAIAVDDVGNIHVAWHRDYDNDVWTEGEIEYRYKQSGSSSWSETVIISKSSWYRTIGAADRGLRSLFRQPSVARPEFGKTFRAYTTLGRVRSLGDGRYVAETGEIIDASDLPASARVRINPRWDPAIRNLAGARFAFGVSAGFQWVEDWNDPYLTPNQHVGRVVVSGAGGVIAWGAGQLASGAVAGSWAGPVGIVVGAGTTFVWIKWVQPVIFDAFALNPGRNLLPLQG